MRMRRGRFLQCQAVLLAIVALGTAKVADATVIREVNVFDPTAVTFTAKSADAENKLGKKNSWYGITLLDFFSGNTTEIDESLDRGSMYVLAHKTGGDRRQLTDIWVGDDSGGWTLDDLNIWDDSESFKMEFKKNKTALQGWAQHDLSATTGMATAGMMGNIVTYKPDKGIIIGQWVVVSVSEPSTLPLIGLGLGGLILIRRRRQRFQSKG